MHLYVHVPFCKRRCSYCDFAIAVRKHVPADEFVEAIKREFALRQLASSPAAEPLETLYFGGGTPSLLSSSHVAALIRFFREEIGFAEGVEVTMEVNPDDVSPKNSEQWLAAGVNRVSLGVQSLNPAVLEWMHRVHTGEDSLRAIRFLTAAGLPSLSVDVIFGLPE
ncbi:MAG: radical SAM protein, partial [Gemmatimonadetes bacterium]|nr:radical SAM protein [Gemmatimonadota bacterium]